MKRITAVNHDGTPNSSFNGAVGPLGFKDGVADVADDSGLDAYVSYCAVNSQFKVEDLDDDSTDAPDAAELKGKALDEALDAAGLAKTGTADEKRQRLADHQQLEQQVADIRGKDVDELKAYAAEFGPDLGDLADSDDQAAIADAIVAHFTAADGD